MFTASGITLIAILWFTLHQMTLSSILCRCPPKKRGFYRKVNGASSIVRASVLANVLIQSGSENGTVGELRAYYIFVSQTLKGNRFGERPVFMARAFRKHSFCGLTINDAKEYVFYRGNAGQKRVPLPTAPLPWNWFELSACDDHRTWASVSPREKNLFRSLARRSSRHTHR